MLRMQKRPIVDIGIVCSNFDESLHFYRDLLGFHVVLDFEIPEDTAVSAGLAPRASLVRGLRSHCTGGTPRATSLRGHHAA